MKLKNLFITLGLSLAVGVGALFGASKAPVKEAKAETTSVTLAGSFNDWNTTAKELELVGDYYQVTMQMAKDVTFKFVVNGNIWVGWGEGINVPSGCFSEAATQGNIQCNVAGEYTFKAKNGIDGYDKKGYGIVIESVVPPTYVDVTLQATFTSEVPSYADIYVVGGFN